MYHSRIKLDADIQGHYVVALRRHLGYLHHKILSLYDREAIDEYMTEYAQTVSLLQRVNTGEVSAQDLEQLDEFSE